LRMTSGVRWNEDYGDPASERRRLLHIQTEWKKGGITGFMQDLPAAAPPGRRWVYNTGESYLVGAVMEGATGMNLVDYMSERFWSKVGMAQDARWWVESPHGGMAIAGSGMNACLGDYARLGLGEGRQIYLIAALDREAPFGRVVGWRDDLIKSDPDVYNAYLRHDPAIAGLPIVGGIGEGGGLDAETVIALRPDLLILNDEQQQFASETGLIEKLAAVGIAVVFIDFRFRPFVNTDPSIRALGKLFGKSETAERLVAWRNAEIARVTDRLAEAGLSDRPLVMIDRIPGYSDDCCLTFGAENFGRMVEMAGGRNLGSELLPGTFGKLNPEAIIAYDPDVVIVTGGSWSALAPGGGWVGLGPGADPAEARRKLRLLSRRPAFQGSKAVRNGRFYGIWHQFYNSPYQFAAIQQIARWIHPELFADLDAEARFRAFHERFLPVPYQPGYWAELGQGDRSPP
jgi:iron complex transport system substrate-binding protein